MLRHVSTFVLHGGLLQIPMKVYCTYTERVRLSCKQQGSATWTKAVNFTPGSPTAWQKVPLTQQNHLWRWCKGFRMSIHLLLTLRKYVNEGCCTKIV